MQDIIGSSYFYHIGFITPNGEGFVQDGTDINVKDRKYFQKAISGKSSVEMITSDRAVGAPKFVLSIPVIKDRKTIGVMFGSYSEKMFKKLFVIRPLGGSGISFICDSAGEVILGSDSPKWIFAKGMPFSGASNIFDGYRNVTSTGERTISDVGVDLAFGKHGTYEYSYENYSRYIIYEPLGINDWFIFNAVDGSTVDSITQSSLKIPFILIFAMAAGMFSIVAIVIYMETRNRKLLEAEGERLRISEQEYKIAAQQSGKIIVRYDIRTKTEYRDGLIGGVVFSESSVTENVPQVYVESGRIDKDSIEEFLNFYKKMENGEETGSCIVRIKCADKEAFAYYKGDFTVIFDDEKKPYHSIISFRDYTEERERELAYGLLRQSISKLPKDKTMSFEHNLTKDTERTASSTFGLTKEEWEKSTFNEISALVAAKQLHREDAAQFVAFVNKERVLAAFYNGISEETEDFRMKPAGHKKYLWYRVTLRMGEYPSTKDVKVFITFEDIDEEKRTALRQQERLKEDPLTKILNRGAFAERVEEIIKEDPCAKHAVIMIDLDNFKLVNDNFGHVRGDEVLTETAQKLASMLRSGDVVGRIGGDEFMVCLKCVPDRNVIEKRAKSICENLVTEISPEVTISGSLGIAMYPNDGVIFEELYQNSDTAVYKAKDLGRNCWEFYSKK